MCARAVHLGSRSLDLANLLVLSHIKPQGPHLVAAFRPILPSPSSPATIFCPGGPKHGQPEVASTQTHNSRVILNVMRANPVQHTGIPPAGPHSPRPKRAMALDPGPSLHHHLRAQPPPGCLERSVALAPHRSWPCLQCALIDHVPPVAWGRRSCGRVRPSRQATIPQFRNQGGESLPAPRQLGVAATDLGLSQPRL
jgi:hypothetical protein